MSEITTQLSTALADRYRVERELGAGGMATVYLAEDLKHDRKVALKVLKPELAAVLGPDRFVREIKTMASLHHPHILPLFDSGEADGFLYYVMPFVEGETLRDKLDREGQLSIDEALRITTNVADALAYAHRNNIVHRDIKPENILLHDGRPVVADFGIALAVDAAGGTRLTETGLSIGTPQYMSPEQATGHREIDGRSDLYSLACVLYEMLAGEPPHTGPSPQQIIMRIVTDNARPLDELRETVPPNVTAAAAKALEKVPADRFEDARAFTQALQDPEFRLAGAGRERQPREARPRYSGVITVVSATLLLIAAAGGWLRPTGDVGLPVVRATLELPPETELVTPAGGFALSPDGRRLAFVARSADGVHRLWVRSLSEPDARPLEGTEGASWPFWSPDGRDLGFFAQGLRRIPAAGGTVQVLAAPTPQPKGAAWSRDGRIVYVPDYRTGLFEVPADGGEASVLTTLDAEVGERSHRWPQFLPDGRTLLFLVQTAEAGATEDRSRIEVLDPDGRRREVLMVNSSAAYAAPGWLLYWQNGSLHTHEFDLGGWQLHGEPRAIAPNVGFDINEWAAFSVSGEGTLVYHSGLTLPWQLEWRDRFGRQLSVEARQGDFSEPALSPDGARVAYVADNSAIWVLDMSHGSRTRLTFEEADHYSPAWSPDGEWVAYARDKLEGVGVDVWRRAASGLGEAELMFEGGSDHNIRDISWSPDRRSIAFSALGDISLLDTESREVRTAVAGPGADGAASFSPDGRWLAYTSDETGTPEVYVVPAAGTARRWRVSRQGGVAPRWSADGGELFFLGPNYEVRAATVGAAGEEPEFGVPEPLFTMPFANLGTTFDLAPDGRFLFRTQASTGTGRGFRLILSWPRLLEGGDP